MKRALYFFLAVIAVLLLLSQFQSKPSPSSVQSSPAASSEPKLASVGSRGVTVAGFTACITEEHFDRVLTMLVQKDNQAAARYIAENPGSCTVLKGGTSVIVDSRVKMGVVRIREVGQTGTLVTHREAVHAQ